MPRPVKKAKTKIAKPNSPELPNDGAAEPGVEPAIAVAEPAPADDVQPAAPPTEAEELEDNSRFESTPLPPRKQRPTPQKGPESSAPTQGGQPRGPQGSAAQKSDGRPPADDKDHIAATSLNIAKLQSMSMAELNQ